MMRRVYCMSALLVLSLLFLTGTQLNAQSSNRRGEPNVLGTGYYVVDSDDDAPPPWRPNYFFVDTNYQPQTWIRVGTGPRQNFPRQYYFFNPTSLGNPDLMDTTNNTFAGPMPIGFNFSFYQGAYDSVTVSSNGFIGFGTYAQVAGGSPPYYTANTNANLGTSPGSAPPG